MPRPPVKSRKRTVRRAQPVAAKSKAQLSPQSLLILHFDASKLRADGLHLGDTAAIAAQISQVGLGSHVTIEDITTKDDLLTKLARLAEAGRTFDVVVAVGHSNTQGIRVSSDLFLGWDAFANYLKPFKPRRLLLVACQAGRWDAGEALFCGLPLLRRVYACPVNASKDFGVLMMFAVPYVVSRRQPKDHHVAWSQVASVALTGRQLREWRRTTDKGNPDAAVFDLLSIAVDPLARGVPDLLLGLFR